MQKTLKNLAQYRGHVAKEWLFWASFLSLTVTSIYFHRYPSFSAKEFQVVFVLFAFFITVKGLEHSNLMLRLSQIIEAGRFVELKFVISTFFLAMFVTNDVALLMVVPLTLLANINKKGILVILEALAANAGSALTPIGNPQNLFIYWIYAIHPAQFVMSIAPFSLFFFVLISLATYLLTGNETRQKPDFPKVEIHLKAYSYLILLGTLILVVLHLLPVFFSMIVFIYALLFDRRSLKVDYALLLTFICFFGLADNLKDVFSSDINRSANIFLYTAGLSQIISNVPATLLLSKFTSQWDALLWGSNVGGFGSLVASLANLIAYKLYISHGASKNKRVSFTALFFVMGYIALAIGIGLYFLIKKY